MTEVVGYQETPLTYDVAKFPLLIVSAADVLPHTNFCLLEIYALFHHQKCQEQSCE